MFMSMTPNKRIVKKAKHKCIFKIKVGDTKRRYKQSVSSVRIVSGATRFVLINDLETE